MTKSVVGDISEKASDALSEAIAETGLGRNWRCVVGAQYAFHVKTGSHVVTLCGTITGISLSDEGGFELTTSSNTQLRGAALKSFAYVDGDWVARVRLKDGAADVYPGLMQIHLNLNT
jgi:hypothetical protein